MNGRLVLIVGAGVKPSKSNVKPASSSAKMGDVERRAALVRLGADVLADTLIKLTPWNKEVDETVERLVCVPERNVARFKDRLANLSCMDAFIDWRGLSGFAHEIEFLLADLKASITVGRTGFELVIFFFDSEKDILENCDDDGVVGDVFQNDAVDLLGYFGANCDDKEWLCDALMRLYAQDSYGVRSAIFDNAAQYLPVENVRELIDRLQKERQNEPKDYEKQRWSSAIESLARQLNDPELFEQARRARQQTLSPKDVCDIARMRFDTGDAQAALCILQEVITTSTGSHEYNQLLLAIHRKLKNKNEESVLAWRMFKEHRSQESLKTLLQAIGKDQRKTVIEKEAQEVLVSKALSYTDAEFLIGCGLLDEAEQYLWDRADQLQGGFYSHILPLAEAMEKDGRFLIATMLYRGLLNAILDRAYAKAYHHGVDYLRKLDAMARTVTRWQNLVPHAGYIQELRISHGRKSSFWGQYEH